MKKSDDKWTRFYAITAIYLKTCAVEFSDSMRIFPVFHNFLLRPAEIQLALLCQDLVNDAKSRYVEEFS
jgi:hypothetical protein